MNDWVNDLIENEDVETVEDSNQDEFFNIPVNMLIKNELNPYEIDDERINSLSDSILEFGQIQPISVKKTTGGYDVVDGNTRVFAIEKLYAQGKHDGKVKCLLLKGEYNTNGVDEELKRKLITSWELIRVTQGNNQRTKSKSERMEEYRLFENHIDLMQKAGLLGELTEDEKNRLIANKMGVGSEMVRKVKRAVKRDDGGTVQPYTRTITIEDLKKAVASMKRTVNKAITLCDENNFSNVNVENLRQIAELLDDVIQEN